MKLLSSSLNNKSNMPFTALLGTVSTNSAIPVEKVTPNFVDPGDKSASLRFKELFTS